MLTKGIALVLVLFSLPFFGLHGCGRKNSELPRERVTFDNLPSGAVYDSELTGQEREVLETALAKLGSLRLNAQNVDWFREIFGGSESNDVNRFLEDRAKFFVSSSTNWISRVRINGQPVEAGAPRSVHPDVVALNLGTELWINAVANAPHTLQFIFNDRLLDIPSTRIGIIQLGPGFTRHHALELAAVFVHEARHSDCTGGLRASDLERIRRGEVPQNPLCGHTHVRCPPGHDYAGLFACDGHAWGAYSTDSVYSAGIVLGCVSCNETEKQIAGLQSIDSLSRVLVDVESMLDGDFGSPDMSSSDQVLAE